MCGGGGVRGSRRRRPLFIIADEALSNSTQLRDGCVGFYHARGWGVFRQVFTWYLHLLHFLPPRVSVNSVNSGKSKLYLHLLHLLHHLPRKGVGGVQAGICMVFTPFTPFTTQGGGGCSGRDLYGIYTFYTLQTTV